MDSRIVLSDSLPSEATISNQPNAVMATLEEYLELELREPTVFKRNSSTQKNPSRILKRHEPVPVQCRICQHQVENVDRLKVHYVNEHTKEELAEKLISALHPVTTNAKNHIAPSKQQNRKVPVKKSSNLIHICPVCEKQISGKGNLDKHLIRHRTLKPFCCDQCDKTFSAKRDLNLHVTRHHSDERPHVCPICSKGFVDKGYLKRHMEFHNENRIFVCDQCGKSFNTESGLNKHTKTHNPERPFMCEICSKCFRAKYDLTAHKRNMHK